MRVARHGRGDAFPFRSCHTFGLSQRIWPRFSYPARPGFMSFGEDPPLGRSQEAKYAFEFQG